MKKKWIFLASLITVIVISIVLIVTLILNSNSNSNSNLSSIEIGFKPFKTSYYVGETFESRGLTVKAVYKTGEKVTLANDEYTIDAPILDKEGEETVIIKYKQCKAKLTITVSEEPTLTGIRLDTGKVNKYILKDTDYSKQSAGVIVYESFSDGTEQISKRYELSEVDTSSTGTKTVTVTCENYSDSYDIEVVYGLHFVPADPNYDESEYLYVDWGSDAWAPPKTSQYHRSADGNKVSDGKNIGAYYTYYIDFGSSLSKAVLYAQVKFQTRIEISFDDVNYQTIYMPIYSTTVTEQEFDLKELLDGTEGKMDFSENKGGIYFRFSDPTMADGFGADLFDFKIYYDLADSSLYKIPKGYYTGSHEKSFKVDTDEEKKFLYAQQGSSVGTNEERGQHRFNNAPESYFIYGIDFGSRLTNLNVQINMQGQVKLEASVDGVNWYTLCDYDTYASYAQFSYLMEGSISNFSKNSGKLYLKFTDSDNDGSFGADVFDLTFKYSLANDAVYKEPTGIPYKDLDIGQTTGYRLEIVPYTDTEEKFLYDSMSTGKMSDDEGEFRFTDGIGTFITYGIDLGGKVSDATLYLKIGQKFQKVEISFDGKTWNTVLHKSDNIGVKNVQFTLSEIAGFENNNGCVFVRLLPGDGYEGAFGITFYNLRLHYNLADGVAYIEPTGITDDDAEDRSEHKLIFEAYTEKEEKFLFENKGTGKMSDDDGTFRFIDGQDAYLTYGIDVGSQMEAASIHMKVGQKYQKIEVSFDGKTWETLLNIGNNVGVKNYNYDLTSVSGFSNNAGKVYVRFSGGKGYAGAFGITVFDFELSYKLVNDDLYKDPVGITSTK